MATKKELEERIERLNGEIDFLRDQYTYLLKRVRDSDSDLDHVKSKVGVTPDPECITIQRGDDKRHKVYLNAGDKVVINGHEIGFKRTDEGQLVCDHTAYNPTSEFTASEEPDYLQVGDQWRDSEGNEYVLAMWKRPDSVLYPYKFSLVNKETGGLLKSGQLNSREPKFINDCTNRTALGITDSMTKIK